MLAVRNFVTVLFSLLLVAKVACGNAPQDPSESAGASATRWVALPTNRDVQAELPSFNSKPDLSSLIRPRFGLAAEWEPKTDGVEVANYDARVTIPTYPLYGPPPPLVSAGFSYTQFRAPVTLGLPSSLYDFSLGATWMRTLSERWMLRFMASAAFASDLNNTSSDAWQFRGGAFAVYRWTPDFQVVFGAFASGREDIPVLPGFGANWTPSPFWRVDLIMPRPRVSYLVAHTGQREHWVFLGGGLSGGTWAYEGSGLDDKLTYREWRFGLGWESGPTRQSPFMRGDGLTLEAELGYAFGRQFEFDRRPADFGIDGALLLRLGANF